MKKEYVLILALILGVYGGAVAQDMAMNEMNEDAVAVEVVGNEVIGNVESANVAINEENADIAPVTNAVISNTEVIAGIITEKVIVGNTICPVRGVAIQPGTLAQFEYNGKIYNFCCPMCIETFKEDPEKYLKNLAEKEKAAAEAADAAAVGKK